MARKSLIMMCKPWAESQTIIQNIPIDKDADGSEADIETNHHVAEEDPPHRLWIKELQPDPPFARVT